MKAKKNSTPLDEHFQTVRFMAISDRQWHRECKSFFGCALAVVFPLLQQVVAWHDPVSSRLSPFLATQRGSDYQKTHFKSTC